MMREMVAVTQAVAVMEKVVAVKKNRQLPAAFILTG